MNYSRLLQRYLQRLLIDDYILIQSMDTNTQTIEVSLFGSDVTETYTYDCIYGLLTISTIAGKPIAEALLQSVLFTGLPHL